MIVSSLEDEPDNSGNISKLRESLEFDFRIGFEERVTDKIFSKGAVKKRQDEFDRSFNLAFYRIALSAVAAIVLLMISIFLREGSLSFDSMLGLSDGYTESIICLLTGN